jgi:lipopolysaccharide transport system ATP-binding protein
MEDVRHHGRTVLLVSHNMSAVTRLCQRALLISGGALAQDGPASEVATSYLLTNLQVPAGREWTDRTDPPGNDVVRLRAIRVVDDSGALVESTDIRRPVGIEMTYEVLKPGYCLVPKYEIFSDTGICLFSTFDTQAGWRSRFHDLGTFSGVVWIPGNFLAEGTVLVTASMFSPEPQRTHFRERDVVAFQVVDRLDPDTARGGWEGPVEGVVRPLLEWTITRRDDGEAVGAKA